MFTSLLPIGTVVRIKGLNKPVMIFGFLQKTGIKHVQNVDCVGVPYPEGNIGRYAQIGFQRTDILEVLFEGFKTEEMMKYEELFQTAYTDRMPVNFAEEGSSDNINNID